MTSASPQCPPSPSRFPSAGHERGDGRASFDRARMLHVAVEMVATGHHPAAVDTLASTEVAGTSQWIRLASSSTCHQEAPDSSENVERIRAADLGEVRSIYRRLAKETLAAGASTSRPPILVDIEVLIAPQAQQARRLCAELEHRVPTKPSTLRYIGTPVGLAGLIADIGTAGVAEGVTLLPLILPADVLEQIVTTTIPWLQSHGFVGDGVFDQIPLLPATRTELS